jgi:N-acetyl-anhydromuramyl-L-alanine amidase AmpD
MLKIVKYKGLKPTFKQNKKNKIILVNTFRGVREYLISLKYRHNGEYNKIPNYIICKNGTVIKLLENQESGKFFKDDILNRNSIIIAIENMGWLEKNNEDGTNINWFGYIYKGDPYYKKWRDYDYWDNYTEEQLISLSKVCAFICDKMKIFKKFIGHNTKKDIANNFNGILTRSNLSTIYTDVSPSFDIKKLEKLLEKEK